jgi:hypothetical protein
MLAPIAGDAVVVERGEHQRRGEDGRVLEVDGDVLVVLFAAAQVDRIPVADVRRVGIGFMRMVGLVPIAGDMVEILVDYPDWGVGRGQLGRVLEVGVQGQSYRCRVRTRGIAGYLTAWVSAHVLNVITVRRP